LGRAIRWTRNGLSLTPGSGVTLNSITLLPHFSLSGYAGPVTLPFGMAYDITARNAATSTSYLTVENDVPITINLHSDFYDISRLDLFLDSCGENEILFYNYRRDHGTPESTFLFGFTIQSMDVTIAPETVVPEPGTATLLGLGLLGFRHTRRKLKNRL
jgi:hypothetical protein